jgi:hypothetical protein
MYFGTGELKCGGRRHSQRESTGTEIAINLHWRTKTKGLAESRTRGRRLRFDAVRGLKARAFTRPRRESARLILPGTYLEKHFDKEPAVGW